MEGREVERKGGFTRWSRRDLACILSRSDMRYCVLSFEPQSSPIVSMNTDINIVKISYFRLLFA